VRALSWEGIGLVRDAASLDACIAELCALVPLVDGTAGEVRNLRLVAELVARAALERRESRGAHFRADATETRPEWRRRLVLSLPPGRRGGEPIWSSQAVEMPPGPSAVVA
jgi:aspartate oxidase